MKNALILHGKPTRERYFDSEIPKPHEANWFPWIKMRLIEAGIQTSVPHLPRPYFPDYQTYKSLLEAERVDDDTGLVGHSAGAEFILRWLSSDNHTSVEQVVLVAPYRDYQGKYGDFSSYNLDASLAERVGKLTIMSSTDDDEPILRRTEELVSAFPSAQHIELNGYGHFRIGHNMESPEFPELLHVLTR